MIIYTLLRSVLITLLSSFFLSFLPCSLLLFTIPHIVYITLTPLTHLITSPPTTHQSQSKALNVTRQFQSIHKKLLNNNCRAFFAFMSASRWLGFRLDAVTVALLALCTFGAVLCKKLALPISPNLLAVGLSYVLQLTGLFQW